MAPFALLVSILRRNMEVMYARLLTPPNNSFFLFGARGTGKTTWLKQFFPKAHWFNFLDEALFQEILVSPQVFSERLRALKPGQWVVVDEVQRLPNLLNEVHRGIEDFKLNFVLTGSSARKLKNAGVNLLAGRARLRTMLPFLPRELKEDFNIESILRWGGIPLIWNAEDKDEILQAYVQTYIREEIQAEALTRNLAGFARALPVAALFNGQVLNTSSLSRDAEIQRKTAEGYVQILEDTLLVKKIWPYGANVMVREPKKPKLYWVDPGIVRAVKGVRGPPSPEERGGLFETYVFSMIRHELENTRRYSEVFYWASASLKTEVDFLLLSDTGIHAIEVKSTAKVRQEDYKGLRALRDLKGLKRRIIVYLGEAERRTEDGIEVLPLQIFDQALAAGLG